MKRFWLFALFVAVSMLALNVSAFADESSTDSAEDVNSALGSLASRVANLEKNSGFNVQVHGFVETDMINDSTQSFTEVVGDGAVKPPGSYAGDNGESLMSMRNTRLSVLATAPEIGGWKTKAYIETDFYGYNPGPGYAATSGVTTSANVSTEANEYHIYTQPVLRMRHAFLDAENDGWDILVGQYWTFFGWTGDYILATVDVSPIMGTIYEREPQVKVMKTLKFGDDAKLQIGVDAERPEQLLTTLPNFNAGIRFIMDSWKGGFAYATGASKLAPFSIGITGRAANYVWEAPLVATTNDLVYGNVWGQAVAVNALIPILPANDLKDFSAVITGEWTAGAGDADAFNGGFTGGLSAISNAAYAANVDAGMGGFLGNNFSLAQLTSWNAQLQIHLPKDIGSIVTAGYGEVFSYNVGALASTPGGAVLSKSASSYNDDSNMFANIMQDMTDNIRLGVEYVRFDTHYLNSFATGNPIPAGTKASTNDAIDNRVQVSAWYRF